MINEEKNGPKNLKICFFFIFIFKPFWTISWYHKWSWASKRHLLGGSEAKKTHESDSYVLKIWWFWPKNRQKSGFLPLHFNWQLMAMVFDPNFGKNMNNWYITKERNVASLRQTPKFWLRGIFDPKISKKVDFFN